jgi:hypothetical protein
METEECCLLGCGTVWMEATRSSGMSVYNEPTRRYIPENGILHSHRRENLKPYT